MLGRIGKGCLIGDLQEVNRRIIELASLQESDEDLIASAPEEFLDPIMSTIMMNPVILPSSKKIVDRSTIARCCINSYATVVVFVTQVYFVNDLQALVE